MQLLKSETWESKFLWLKYENSIPKQSLRETC